MIVAVLLMSLASVVTACESTETSPIAGTWVATSFVFTGGASQPPIDVLALGGGLTITVAGNNSTTGTLTIPGELLGGGPDVVSSMSGTAIVNGNTVEFDQGADTFVRDVPWTLSGNTLRGVLTESGVTVDITLTRQ